MSRCTFKEVLCVSFQPHVSLSAVLLLFGQVFPYKHGFTEMDFLTLLRLELELRVALRWKVVTHPSTNNTQHRLTSTFKVIQMAGLISLKDCFKWIMGHWYPMPRTVLGWDAKNKAWKSALWAAEARNGFCVLSKAPLEGEGDDVRQLQRILGTQHAFLIVKNDGFGAGLDGSLNIAPRGRRQG